MANDPDLSQENLEKCRPIDVEARLKPHRAKTDLGKLHFLHFLIHYTRIDIYNIPWCKKEFTDTSSYPSKGKNESVITRYDMTGH